MMQLTGRMVVIQQSKIEVLDINEIDVISGGSSSFCFLWWCPRLEIADSDPVDPMEPVAPDLNLLP